MYTIKYLDRCTIFNAYIIKMSCTNKEGTDCCGKCVSNLLSTDYIKNKSIVKVSRIAANLVWMNEFNDSGKYTDNIQYIQITCTNNISIGMYNRNTTISLSTTKYIYCKLINEWYDYHKGMKSTSTYKYIEEKLNKIKGHSHINKIRVEGLSVAKYLQNMTICNKNCTYINPEKQISNCKIPLSDINRIVTLNSNGLVDVLNTILYTIKDLHMLNLTIDLDTSYITCTGNIIMERTFVKSKCSLSDMKSIYIYYLSAWCSANFCKQHEVNKIRENINNVNKAKRMTQIYELSCELLDTIQY